MDTSRKKSDTVGVNTEKVIHFPEGLPAFEDIKDFVLINNKDEAPFLWLQAVSAPELAFVAIDPFLVCPEYRPEISDLDLKSLKIKDKDDALLLSIVNMKGQTSQGITTNLVGVILVNWKEKLGKQVIIKNHHKYSIKFALN